MIYYIQKSSKNAIRSIIYSGFYSGFASCVQPAEMHTEDFAITGYETNVFLRKSKKCSVLLLQYKSFCIIKKINRTMQDTGFQLPFPVLCV